MLQSHDTVLQLWDRRFTSGQIAKAVKMRPSYVRIIVQRARAKGDKRAHKRQANRLYPLGSLPNEALSMLAIEAGRRNISESDLAIKIITVALKANIVGAILDDGEGE